MIKQTMTWTALPKASDGPKQAGTELRLSAFVAPRLWNDDPTVTVMPLGDFPDWLDWPAAIAAATWQVEFTGGPTLPATVESVAPRSDLWQALFKPETTVKPFAFEDLSGAVIESFPAAVIYDTVKGIYQKAAIDAGLGGGSDLPGRGVLAADPDLSDIAEEVQPPDPWVPPPTDRGPVFVGGEEPPEPPEPGGGEEPQGCSQGCLGCLLLPFQLLRKLLERLGLGLFLPASVSAKKQAFTDLRAFVQPHTVQSAPLPSASQIEDQYDFHQMVSSLGDYPELMRQLGLVVDLVVTLDAALPADQGTVRVTPTIALATPTSHVRMRTQYQLGVEQFLARPRPGSDLADGLLRLNDATRFRVAQADVAGSAVKLQNTATNVCGQEKLKRWPANAPQEAGLPALETAGISIVRATQVPELTRRFTHGFALNSFLAAIDTSPVTAFKGAGPAPAPSDELWADDVVRGYRLDVWDDKSAAWHSLCRRLGTYDFLDGPGPLALEDEGFVQMGATESLVPPPERKLKVHESLFTWDGWSLAAPRPGRTLMPDQSTGSSTNSAVTQFQLETAFQAKPGSLPRLRFGWTYRVRARMVDLAGNSAFGPDDAAFAAVQPQATPQFPFGRFEPVAPPPLVLRAVPVEGESLEHLVVRSTVHDAPAVIASQRTERHVVPPKTSQQMAERHETFDGSPAMRKDQVAYDLASREAGSLIERVNPVTGTLEPIPGTIKDEDLVQKRVYWLQPNAQFEVAFLPDNFARGVLFLGLPGMPAPDAPGGIVDGVNRIAFTGGWPDLEPFRLRAVGLAAGAAPAPPSFNAVDRVLTVEVPQGETFNVRYSSFFAPADLDKMGVWEWVKQANPVDLAKLTKRATDGRNWLHLPFRELILTHAVQQPLAIPAVSALAPTKVLGDTQATLNGTIAIDAKSTGKIDLRASWSDPFDDLKKPAFDALTDQVQQEMQVAEIVALDAANDALAVSKVVHALGDTKYHRVSYTPTGTTRFREYFPPAVLANPQDLIRPTPSEAGVAFPLDIPSSARPDAVKPLYAVPTFAWTTTESAGIVHKTRKGGGFRLYMERPWFSSGAGELLGLVLRPAKYAPLSANWKKLRHLVSEWGMDPLWSAAETAPLTQNDFDNAVKVKPNGLTLAELAEQPGLDIGVAGFEPEYDGDRNLWFCDVALKAERHYFPFLRLALARYQPISVADAHLSRVVPSDFIQILPHRRVRYDLTQLGATNEIAVRVSGPAYFNRQREQLASPLVVARIERRLYDTGDELGWEVVATQAVPVVQRDPEDTVWEGRVLIPSSATGPLRLVILEAEVYDTDPQTVSTVTAQLFGGTSAASDVPSTAVFGQRSLGFRIAFADAIELP